MKTSCSPLLTTVFVILHCRFFSRIILSGCLAALGSSFVVAQGGPLTPPGAPAPTMRSLQEIFTQDTTTQTNVGTVQTSVNTLQTSVNNLQDDPRTPISSLPFTISTSGSYYLTGNLSVTTGTAISINVDNVTLDLNGFTISSTHATGNGTGVLINGIRKNITVKNGNIRGTTTFAAGVFTPGGFLDGVANLTSSSANLRISELNVQGMADDGINLVNTTEQTFVVERCNVQICAGYGIQASVVRDCTAAPTGDSAINADMAIHCSGETVNTAAAGAAGVLGFSTVENCTGISVSGNGVQSSNLASNSVGTSTSGAGLAAGDSAINCKGTSTSGIGLSARIATNCTGISTSGSHGLFSNLGTVSFSRGQRDGGTAISTLNAIGCTVTGTGTVTATNKSLGTP